ncbi:MAG: hypothetical protein R3352_05165 [Salinisphaeraceae bacterium]|nr:hypothetical protein [Salinisphaeraceae bacterium]
MQELLQDNMMVKIMAEPLWLQAWVYWMMIINTAAVFFLKHPQAKFVLGAWVGNVITMTILFEAVGYVRLLGLSHVIWWTPLVIYLFMGRNQFPPGKVATWLWVLLITNSASLVIDYIDVVRYFMGDGALG